MTKPGLYHIVIFHDSWCKVFKGENCNCKPETKTVTDDEFVKMKKDTKGGDDGTTNTKDSS